jgi:predicted ATPase/DNA-binding SARP family transcriptional activator
VSAATVEFRILGPLEVRADDEAVALGGPKPRALLAILLLHANEPVSAERLALALWGEDAPADAIKTVQVHMSRLRKALGDPDRVVTTSSGYRLRVEPDDLDAERFERLIAAGRRELAAGRAGEAASLLREALGMWRGAPLDELASAPFAAAEIGRLEEQHVAALELRVEADLAVGRHAEVVPELQRLVAAHPWRERLHAQLMLALYRTGRQADALQAYRDARQALVEQLGIEPGAELRALERAILAQDPSLTGERSAPVSPTVRDGRRPGRIPLPPTATVGRRAELARLRALAGDPAVRLATVVGPPGVGKTRLAVELARSVAPELRDGAAFVSLAPLEAAEHVASTIARDLGVTLFPGEAVEEALARDLGERELVLVLDNFEHLLDAAPLVAELLAAAPEVTVLATSREPLRIRAERLFRLDPLAVQGPAVELFEAVAQARMPGFTLEEDDLPAAVEVCRRLDGLPLAIELAAGSLGLLSVGELAERLRRGVGTLGVGARDAPARQRTLAATLEWSYALLTPPEQSALAALAVFAGGCTTDAAEAVTGAPLAVLETLVAKNLAVHQAAEGRLGLLETVREFAAQRLAERHDAVGVRQRHCEYYLAFTERARPEVDRTGSPALRAALDRELDNLRGAFGWALGQPADPDLALRLATARSGCYGRWGLDREAGDWLVAALAKSGERAHASVRAAALEAYAYSFNETRTTERAEAAARESLELRRSLGDRAGAAASLNALARVMAWVHRNDEAYRYASEAEQLAAECGAEQARIDALWTMADDAPTFEQTLALADQVLAIYRARGNQLAIASLQNNLTYTALIHGEYVVAGQLSADLLAASEALGEPALLTYGLGNAGLAWLFTGDADAARRAFVRQLRLVDRHRHYRLVYEPLIGLAGTAAIQEQDRLAATLHGAADAVTLERPHPGVVRQLDEICFAAARARLGEAAWQAAYEGGARLDRAHAIETALLSATSPAAATAVVPA